MNDGPQRERRTWTEQFEVAASELVDRVKELVREGNVRKLIIKTPGDRVLLEVPLNAGVAVGTVVTLVSPVVAVASALGIMLARIKLEVVRTDTRE